MTGTKAATPAINIRRCTKKLVAAFVMEFSGAKSKPLLFTDEGRSVPVSTAVVKAGSNAENRNAITEIKLWTQHLGLRDG